MIRGLYSVATAMDGATVNQEIVADNLANASTPGFRRHGLAFQVVQPDTPVAPPSGIRAGTAGAGAPPPASLNAIAGTQTMADTSVGTQPSAQYTIFTQGALQHTGNPFDVAIAGDDGAFFALDGPQGPVFTRNGVFQLDGRGQLVSPSGMRVRGVGGRITIQPNTQTVTIGRDGSVYADGNLLGQLQIAHFPQPGNVLQRVGTTLFSGPNVRQQTQTSPTYRIEQGYRETSNVEAVHEMVSMITGMRHYEAAERALRALGEAVAGNTKPS